MFSIVFVLGSNDGIKDQSRRFKVLPKKLAILSEEKSKIPSVLKI